MTPIEIKVHISPWFDDFVRGYVKMCMTQGIARLDSDAILSIGTLAISIEECPKASREFAVDALKTALIARLSSRTCK